MLRKKISYILLAIIIALVFRKFFLSGPLVSGDAPYFYKEGLKELVNFPNAWTSRGNSLGGINLFLWIYPLMVLYGLFGNFLHLNNDLILRVLFYIPSLISSLVGIYLLTKTLKLSKTVTFFATLVYIVNTYFLLLVDGGQVGIVLAYGLFPLVLNFLLRDSFLIALIFSFILAIVDFRIVAICILTAVLIKPNLKKMKFVVFVSICLIGLSAYWIIPTLKLMTHGINLGIAGLQDVSLINSLFLFSPHWPANEFGKVVAPYFYFSLIPILIFLPLFVSRKKETIWLIAIFLFFAFLSKGESYPLGSIYKLFISTKVGSVFRDSTKFFIPLILIAGILIGKSVEILKHKLIYIFVFIYLTLLITPAIVGNIQGVLGKNQDLSDYQKVYNLISKDNNFSRTAWFIEKSPFAFHLETKQALDAKDLVNFRPFASMNVGTSDHFNFMNNRSYLDWFNLLGIKYLVFNGNPRINKLDKSDQEDWTRLNNIVSNDSRLQALNIGTSFPVYKNSNPMPHEFFVSNTFLILGGDDIYQKFESLESGFSIRNQGFIFIEDGKFDPSVLQNVASTSAILVFNNKTKNDLKMSFLQKYFVSPQEAYQKDWSVFSTNDYLNYKYQLLIRDIKLNDFDFGKGIAFSTKLGEKISFNLNVPEDGNYILATRKLDNKNQNMTWQFEDKNNLKHGVFNYVVENKNNIEVLNTVAIIPVEEMKTASQLTQNYLGIFPSYDMSKIDDELKIKEILKNNKWENHDINDFTKPGWVILTDIFNENWDLMRVNETDKSYPMYSMVNGFYVNPEFGKVSIVFKGDEYLKWGIYFSCLSFLIITVFVLWKNSKK